MSSFTVSVKFVDASLDCLFQCEAEDDVHALEQALVDNAEVMAVEANLIANDNSEAKRAEEQLMVAIDAVNLMLDHLKFMKERHSELDMNAVVAGILDMLSGVRSYKHLNSIFGEE
jgi:hypothetical protein